jgi:hypothetical protein
MANAALSSASNRLGSALKTLKERWEITQETWDDQVRREFEDRQLIPLEAAVKSAMVGMQELGDELSRVRIDCSDRSDSW